MTLKSNIRSVRSSVAEHVPSFLQTRQMRRRIMVQRARRTASSVLSYSPVRWAGAALAAYGAYRLVQRLREENLTGQVVLITGGSRGLGFLLAHEFARKGCRIAICGRDGDTLDRARDDLRSAGADVLATRCDVCDAASVAELVESVTNHFGCIDVLVNNAGIIQVGPIDSTTEADYAHAMNVMFWGPLRTTLAVLPQMRDRGCGRIVNITSIGGMISIPHMLPYNCAKFASVGLSQGLRAELARYNIRVTTIVPGLMRVGSHLNAEFRGDADREYKWFTLGATMPLLSMSGRRAARQIVRATQRGEAMRVLGMPAAIMERVHGLAPGTVARLLGLVNRALPELMHQGNGSSRGVDIAERLNSRLFQSLTSPGVTAAEESNQFRQSDW